MSQSAAAAAPRPELLLDLAHAGRVLVIAALLALLVGVMGEFALESEALVRVSWLALAGFVVHAFLPLRLRRPFFVALSLGAIYLVFEARNSAWLIGVTGVVVAICHLPIALRARAALVAGLGAVLLTMRAGWLPSPWPILGSMLMFRPILYFFDRSHEKEASSPWETLSFFFMLPNPVFALFPVVDYRTMQRTYYNEEDWRIYLTGVQWMLRGVVHLILYRLVYYHLLPAPAEVVGPLDLAQFLVANFSLYLHVSGTFHIAIGMLHLFGFNLPETHFFFYLSSTINDFWRRINIYWKDFMLKVFYYPMFFRLRRSGATRALVLSTVFVVIVTWIGHSYQWFWLRGSFPVHWQDAVFWSSLGVLMIANSLYENRRSGARGRRARTWTVRSALGQGLAIAGTFTFISLLWSLWTSESWDQFASLFDFARADGATREAGRGGVGSLLVALAAFGALVADGSRGGSGGRLGRTRPPFARAVLVTAGTLGATWLVAWPALHPLYGARAGELIESLKTTHLNRADAAELQRSYYEDLIDVGRFNPQLNRLYNRRPEDWVSIEFTDAVRHTGDLLEHELLPDLRFPYKGGLLVTNRFGMRDRDYTREKPPGAYRLGVIGGSYGMGPGVENDELFLDRVEERLREARGPDAPPVEVLNFSVGGYFAPQRLAAVERKVLDFDLDALVYLAHESEVPMIAWHLRDVAKDGVVPEYPELARAMERAGYRPGERLPDEEALQAQGEELLAAIYHRVADAARARGATPVWLYVPTLAMRGADFDPAPLEAAAREAGFAIVRLDPIWEEREPGELQIAPWDMHPNARGHELIAENLFEKLVAWKPDLVGRERSRAAPRPEPSPRGDEEP